MEGWSGEGTLGCVSFYIRYVFGVRGKQKERNEDKIQIPLLKLFLLIYIFFTYNSLHFKVVNRYILFS